jgi:hypothetical protein
VADDVPAGWYRRAGEPGMLTWWDGSSWTDRRTPIPGGPLDPKTSTSARQADDEVPPGDLGDDDDRPSENSGPIPVIETDADAIADDRDPVFADPTSVFASVPAAPDNEYPQEEERSRPRLLLLLLPLFFIGLAAAALIATSGSDDDDPPNNDESSDELTTIGEAVEVAERAGLPVNLSGSTIGSLIDDICEASGRSGADATLALRISQLPVQPDQVTALLNALGKGAAVRCPDDIAADSGLLLRTGELAIERLGPGTSTTLTTDTTEVAAPPVTDTTGVTAPSSPTTRRPTATTTPTTARPTPTTAPATTVTSAPPPCNPNYGGCLNRPGDYDCIGRAGDPDWQPGDGPNFVSGPITVTGSDVYDLDVDGNGIGCERAPQT